MATSVSQKRRNAPVEARRRAELTAATIEEIGAAGSLRVTVGQIARRAGLSSALAFHYFGDKDALVVAAMRSLLTQYGMDVRAALSGCRDPRARLEAVVRTSFSPSNFRREIVAAWLNFYVYAQTSPQAARLLHVYRSRLTSTLAHDLRALVDSRATDSAERIAGLIDGLYLHAALDEKREADTVIAHLITAIDRETKGP